MNTEKQKCNIINSLEQYALCYEQTPSIAVLYTASELSLSNLHYFASTPKELSHLRQLSDCRKSRSTASSINIDL